MAELANFAVAVEVLLGHEGSKFNPKDAGKAGAVRYGITQRYILNTHRAADAYTYVKNMTEILATDIYRQDFWLAHKLYDLESQTIATALLSFMVNMGEGEPVKMLQVALNTVGARLEEDGAFGPRTLAAANVNKNVVIPTWKLLLEAYYRKIAPTVGRRYLKGWLKRLDELLPAGEVKVLEGVT